MSKKTVTFTQIKSKSGCSERHLATLRGLGLGRIGSTRTLEDTPAVRGMLNQLKYMIQVETQ